MPTSTVCLIARNEERAILEWLAYQKLIGFDRVLVYDNDSTDETPAIVRRAARNDPSISYKPWPNQPGLRPQPTAYADGLSRCETDWIAFFDTDEFLLLERHATIDEFLASFDADAGGILVNWRVFGSSGLQEAGPELVIERFTRCAPPAHGKNLFCKTIVRPSAVSDMKVHSALLREGRYVDVSGQPVAIEFGAGKTPRVQPSPARLNHYLLKSREEFLLKQSRGHASRPLEDIGKHHIDEEFWRSHDLNDQEDHAILRHVDGIRRQMERLAA